MYIKYKRFIDYQQTLCRYLWYILRITGPALRFLIPCGYNTVQWCYLFKIPPVLSSINRYQKIWGAFDINPWTIKLSYRLIYTKSLHPLVIELC